MSRISSHVLAVLNYRGAAWNFGQARYMLHCKRLHYIFAEAVK